MLLRNLMQRCCLTPAVTAASSSSSSSSMAAPALVAAGRRHAAAAPRSFFFSTNAALPSNLQLAQPEVVLAKPPPLPMPEINYVFPPLHVPSSVAVTVFKQPGSLAADPVPLDSKIFGVAIRKDIVHEVVRYQRHKARQPKKTKRMSEISGSNKKPRPQKGGGQSQAGHKRNSVWRGGPKAHGPVIRDYSIGLNRKYRAYGMMVALAAKLREGNLVVFDKIACDTHRTKDLHALFVGHGLADKTTLVVDDDFDPNFALACKNMAAATLMAQTATNVYDVLKREKIALSVSALANLQQRITAQYGHQGKRHSLLRDLHTYEVAAASVEDSEVKK